MNLDSTINKVKQLSQGYSADTPEYRVLTRAINQLQKIMKKGTRKP
jgi:hypothetical protein